MDLRTHGIVFDFLYNTGSSIHNVIYAPQDITVAVLMSAVSDQS